MFPDDDEFEFVGPDRGWNDEPSRADLFREFRSPVYTTDADGWLTYYNDAAADLWGYRPELGKTRWCGCWRIYTSDGTPLPLDQCPMAIAVREERPVRGVQAVLERPDGTLIPFMPYPTPLRDASGTLVAASNVLLKITKLNGSDPIDLTAEQWAEPIPERRGAALDLDRLTGALQATLATLADAEFGYQADCERLDDWSGPADEKQHILGQLEQKRQRQRAALNERLQQLKRRAMQAMADQRCESGPPMSTAHTHSPVPH
ncbi:histidine kinase [Methylobacterium sp. CM6257]